MNNSEDPADTAFVCACLYARPCVCVCVNFTCQYVKGVPFVLKLPVKPVQTEARLLMYVFSLLELKPSSTFSLS